MKRYKSFRRNKNIRLLTFYDDYYVMFERRFVQICLNERRHKRERGEREERDEREERERFESEW